MERRCRKAGKAQAGTYDYWFRRTFNLAVTDDRYLDATMEQIVTEFWARHYDDAHRAGRPEEEEFEDEDFDADKILAAMESGGDDWEDVLNEGG